MIKKNALRDRILQNTKLTSVEILAESELFNDKEVISTPVPMINVALSADPNGGLQPGILMIAGESKHFKTAFGLMMVAAFLDKYKDGIVIFYDSEFGTNDSYFKLFGIDKDRIVHCPITNVEEWKQDIANQIKDITKDDRVMIFVDSIGNLASLKEVTDAEDGKTVADMTRAKQLKSTFRIIGPHLTLKNIPMVVINHTYKEIGLYPKDIVSGGTGSYYNSNDIWIIGRQQDTEGEGSKKVLQGYNFIINIEKSRTVKEKSRIPINVSFEDGINIYSGIFDAALEADIISSPSKGNYEYGGAIFKRKNLEADQETMSNILNTPAFTSFLRKKYALNQAVEAHSESA